MHTATSGFLTFLRIKRFYAVTDLNSTSRHRHLRKIGCKGDVYGPGMPGCTCHLITENVLVRPRRRARLVTARGTCHSGHVAAPLLCAQTRACSPPAAVVCSTATGDCSAAQHAAEKIDILAV